MNRIELQIGENNKGYFYCKITNFDYPQNLFEILSSVIWNLPKLGYL